MSTDSKNVTLKYLSQHLGLHVSTVSRVLNSTAATADTAAAPETILRIRQLAAELNYKANPIAKSLKTKKSHVIAVLVPKLSDLVLATIYEGIDDEATQHDYFTFVSNTHDLPENQKKLGDMALSRQVDGLIIADAYSSPNVSNPFLEELTAKQIPFVLVSRKTEAYTSVTCDDYLGGELAAQHLLSLGHTRIGIIAGETYASTGILRTQGFVDYCGANGVKILEKFIQPSGFDVDSGYQVGHAMLSLKERPTAIFAVNDFLAIGLMGAARALMLQPGKDIAIVGFNNIDLAKQLPIPLTTVNSPMHKMGTMAMELLLKKIMGQNVTSIDLKPELLVRNSTLDYDHT